jgi:transposase
VSGLLTLGSVTQFPQFQAIINWRLGQETDKTDAGQQARQIVGELDSLWVFLDHDGVDPTNNRAERALRFGVLWRKRSLGTQSEKGNRWVERILSLKETCRLKAKSTFLTLVECIQAFCNSSQPDLSWI